MCRVSGTVCGVLLGHWGKSCRDQAMLPPGSGLALRPGSKPHTCPWHLQPQSPDLGLSEPIESICSPDQGFS